MTEAHQLQGVACHQMTLSEALDLEAWTAAAEVRGVANLLHLECWCHACLHFAGSPPHEEGWEVGRALSGLGLRTEHLSVQADG